MHQTRRVAAVLRSVALSSFALVAVAATVEAQARNLSDPGRIFRAAMARTARPAAVRPAYNLFATPVVHWTDGMQVIGGQFRYASDNLVSGSPVVMSGLLANVHVGAVNKSRLQFDGEIAPWTNGIYSLSIGGVVQHTMDMGTLLGIAPELDIRVNEFVTVAPILYLDRYKVSGANTSTTSKTLGLVGYLTRGTWSMYPEYDLALDDGVEDTYSIKVIKSFTKMKRDPRVFVGAAKDEVFSAGVRFTVR